MRPLHMLSAAKMSASGEARNQRYVALANRTLDEKSLATVSFSPTQGPRDDLSWRLRARGPSGLTGNYLQLTRERQA